MTTDFKNQWRAFCNDFTTYDVITKIWMNEPRIMDSHLPDRLVNCPTIYADTPSENDFFL